MESLLIRKSFLPSVLLAGLFLTAYGLLAFFNRLAVDDFHFLTQVRDLGIWEATELEYETYNTRWAALLLLHVVMSWIEAVPSVIHLWPIMNLVLFIAVVHTILSRLLSESTKWKASPVWMRWMQASSVSAVFFFASPSIGETWFWTTSSCIYLWANMAFLTVLSWFLDRGNKTVLNVLAILSLLFIGGSSEPMALFLLLILVMLVIETYRRGIRIGSMNKGLLVKAFISIVLIGLSLWISMSGEGVNRRSTSFEDIGFVKAFILNIKMTAIVGLKHLGPSLLIQLMGLAFVIPWSYPLVKDILPSRMGVYPFVVLVLALFIYQYPVTYVTQDIMADRTLFFFTVLSFITLFLQMCSWIERGYLPAPGSRIYFFVAILGLAGLSLATAYRVGQGKTYVEVYDSRMEQLIKGCEGQQVIFLRPLPPSGWMYSAEISHSPLHFSNEHLREYLKLECEIAKKKE